MKSLELAKWSTLVFAISGLVALGSSRLAWRLPSPEARPILHDEPLQTPLAEGEDTTLITEIEGHHYSIKPRFHYHLTGMVVETSDAMGWKNITHKAVGDYLNTNDLCVVWGANAETLDLSKFTFSHGDWTCYVSTKSGEAWAQFKMDALSNNHVLPTTPELARTFASVRIGDQVEINGDLVDYSTDGQPPRQTSTVRTDTGNGACEIIYVTDFRFLKRHHEFLYRLAHLALDLMVLSLVVLGTALFILPFLPFGADGPE